MLTIYWDLLGLFIEKSAFYIFLKFTNKNIQYRNNKHICEYILFINWFQIHTYHILGRVGVVGGDYKVETYKLKIKIFLILTWKIKLDESFDSQ